MSIKRKRKFRHLSQKDRDRIDVLAREGYTFQKIAEAINCNVSTISRELQRNLSGKYKKYVASIAQTKADHRKSYCVRKSKFDNSNLVAYMKNKLKEFWSPEQISGRLKKDHPEMHVSHEAIYQYIYSLKNDIERKKLISLLARSHKTRKRKYIGKTGPKTKILNRIGIEQRPLIINERKQPGHWETDTIVCKSNIEAINTTVERMTRLAIISKLNRKNAYNKASSLINRLSKINPNLRRSITYDNGTENAGHTMVNRSLGTQSYFAHPYHSWERGSNENLNGLIRRFIPKKTDLRFVNEEQLIDIEHKLNDRPRKCLNYYTPFEVASSLGFF
ncbi:MAG: IS30 family transposase [Patescibacteria group bacterium]